MIYNLHQKKVYTFVKPSIQNLGGLDGKYTEKKKRAKMALLKSYGKPEGSHRIAILALFFFSV